tara:strand:+ start:4098 stop:4823 length:726 start_codon:yes stop_codon:yes gene_type:complete
MDVSLLFALSAGMVAAFNPCGAAMFPAYVGFQLGSSTESDNIFLILLKGLLLGGAVTIGFVCVFGVVGVVFSLGGQFIGSVLPFMGLAVGILIVCLGMLLLISRRSLEIPILTTMNIRSRNRHLDTFYFGIAYAIASLSCALPIFLAAVGLVVGTGVSLRDFSNIIVGTFAYSLGMGIVMTFVTITTLFFEETVSVLVNKLTEYVNLVGSTAMVLAGVYIVYYWTLGDGSELLFMRISALI